MNDNLCKGITSYRKYEIEENREQEENDLKIKIISLIATLESDLKNMQRENIDELKKLYFKLNKDNEMNRQHYFYSCINEKLNLVVLKESIKFIKLAIDVFQSEANAFIRAQDQNVNPNITDTETEDMNSIASNLQDLIDYDYFDFNNSIHSDGWLLEYNTNYIINKILQYVHIVSCANIYAVNISDLFNVIKKIHNSIFYVLLFDLVNRDYYIPNINFDWNSENSENSVERLQSLFRDNISTIVELLFPSQFDGTDSDTDMMISTLINRIDEKITRLDAEIAAHLPLKINTIKLNRNELEWLLGYRTATVKQIFYKDLIKDYNEWCEIILKIIGDSNTTHE